jgi:hypothetical protein
VAAALLAALPWLVGVRATYDDKAWGPGFELQSYDCKRDGATHVSLTIGPGAAVPTQEGERPIWGHAGVLLGGAWRKHVDAMENERVSALTAAIDMQVPFVMLQGWGQYIEAELSGMGFRTTDWKYAGRHHPFVSRRVYSDAHGRELTVVVLQRFVPDLLMDIGVLRQLRDAVDSDIVVAYGGDPFPVRAVYRAAPRAMRRLHEESAVLDLGQLAAAAKSRASGKPE